MFVFHLPFSIVVAMKTKLWYPLSPLFPSFLLVTTNFYPHESERNEFFKQTYLMGWFLFIFLHRLCWDEGKVLAENF